MQYTIDESDLSRQRLLAHILNRVSERHLVELAPSRPGRWLDVGSGAGGATRMLARFMAADGQCIGLEQDPALVAVARRQDWGGGRVVFQQGDATHLPFEDQSFDFVFTRYLLLHLPNPLDAIREMLRVTKPGSIVFAQEPDFGFTCCHPPNRSYERVTEIFTTVFPDAQIGRKLVHLFREAGAKCPQARADVFGMEYDSVDLKRIYRMTYEAVGAALIRLGRMTKTEFQDLLNEFISVEADPSIVVIGNPVIAVWTSI